ncbi:hypothetical protein BDV27DRAFT_139507 [Aspergillus caelatus]|uniref:Uncharacterized protein n=1 Tax=Aspergillus caelatus TaxID=61420 RepID=A0A5N6ZI67_9EURO|nr:uncharacterized protein BDV27DRAFT_139507 [Aspergillus caelatus]KAE8357337.1 hypothetical protein BDV27DRAFT_139507 [Aspergillus caelatus]
MSYTTFVQHRSQPKTQNASRSCLICNFSTNIPPSFSCSLAPSDTKQTPHLSCPEVHQFQDTYHSFIFHTWLTGSALQ